ncbi:sigma 54-interacting transcriptional regulator, partial [bacterium]|nr:sigma 54-interacting transcriptional regulator [bacterium]
VVGALSVYRPFADDEQLSEDATILGIVASMVARAVLLRRDVLEQQEHLKEENRQLRAELTRRYHPGNIVGNSREMQGVYDQIFQVAKSQATVLINGETGTGKELVAHAIHYASTRAGEPFVRVHCAALPESLIESELFGHVKGAFTGAVSDRKGRFELADGGTIFLDEIGEIPLSIQAKLLRVLQEREFERVGGIKTIKVNVRIIAATHRDLPAMVEKGLFREDLYYRLSVFPIFVPPLVKRKADIILLADHFMAKYAEENGKKVNRLSNEALD